MVTTYEVFDAICDAAASRQRRVQAQYDEGLLLDHERDAEFARIDKNFAAECEQLHS